MAEPMVRVYGFNTGAITRILARELAPGMVRARLTGIEGEVWIAGSQVRQSGYRHGPFDEGVRDVLRQFEALFCDVYPMTAAEWEDGFRRDLHPDREMAPWLRRAEVFVHFMAGRDLSFDQRQDIFQAILTAVSNGKEAVLLTSNPVTLSKRRVREIVDYLFHVRPADRVIDGHVLIPPEGGHTHGTRKSAGRVEGAAVAAPDRTVAGERA
jgi:hypothetical protein